MPEKDQKYLMHTYFSPERMNYQMVRIPIDSCDFSLETYEAMSDPLDTELDSFTLKRDEKWILPMLRDAQNAAGRKLKLMFSPWSPPAFMKTNQSRVRGGKLKKEYYALWAEYLCRYMSEYKKRGFEVCRMSLQNEPKAVQEWDSCIFTAAEEKVFLKQYLYPALEKHELSDIEIFLWDHNKERAFEWTREIIDSETDHMVAGTAVHWYSGDHFEALDLCRRSFPKKKLIVSESCIEFLKYDTKDVLSPALSLSHEIIGDLNHGVTAFYDWNLLLDEEGGPNHTRNFCLAPFLYDRRREELCSQLLQKYLELFSKNLTPGSVRIWHTCYTDRIEAAAFRRPDGKLAVILLNRDPEIHQAVIRLCGREAAILLYPESITSAIISETHIQE